jgi:hypothetical protein
MVVYGSFFSSTPTVPAHGVVSAIVNIVCCGKLVLLSWIHHWGKGKCFYKIQGLTKPLGLFHSPSNYVTGARGAQEVPI